MSESGKPAATPKRLLLISFVILFLEMASIRWLNASVNVLAYFNNFILISCFFGLLAKYNIANTPPCFSGLRRMSAVPISGNVLPSNMACKEINRAAIVHLIKTGFARH